MAIMIMPIGTITITYQIAIAFLALPNDNYLIRVGAVRRETVERFSSSMYHHVSHLTTLWHSVQMGFLIFNINKVVTSVTL